jgi:hypothetical protein
MDFFCQSAEARITFRVALNALIDAQHQEEILLQVILGFGQLFVREMRIQIPNGWGRFRFHVRFNIPPYPDHPKPPKLAYHGKSPKQKMQSRQKQDCTSNPNRNGLQRPLSGGFDFGPASLRHCRELGFGRCAHLPFFCRRFGGRLCGLNLRPPCFLSRRNLGPASGAHFTFLWCFGRCRSRYTKNRGQFVGQ